MRKRLRQITEWGRRHPLLVDALLAASWGVMYVLSTVTTRGSAGDWLLLAGLTVPLVWRRRSPLVVFGVLALVAFVQWLTTEVTLADTSLLIALYGIAVYERRRWGFPAALAVLELGALLATLRYGSSSPVGAFLSMSAFVVAAGALGFYVRTRRDHIAALTDRARRLEIERDQQAQLATAAERGRIARELHDVVAHNLTVMIALADGARLTAAQAPEEADAAMRTVSATGREALGEMRRLLGVLRDSGSGSGSGEGSGEGETSAGAQPLRPQPGLDQLDALLEQVRGAGLATRLTRTGEPVSLSPGAQLTVYRVVQEALTNTLKHARSPSSAEVRLHYGGDVLALEVTDDGAPPPGVPAAGANGTAANGAGAHAAGGHGLAGMRERVAVYGAEVEAGPRPRGGWSVRTQLRLADGEAAGR
ncbi:sensor histidine kinase [Conexibacter woesei]|uniref:histidine kinase n=1 Tax=Conexibacter woesei (strain DSM 14684 / CCUG 47730 / CIP 108061 / JCM 11494 / NBRC 100937 / ID131577) TaxID=469383 RepID=D3F2B8_CONWI|nr:sensor histidine kinase [Conexibacter woesei]ADB52184.1 integral membrane sensor signal transduction histidine kinase [Conexibacter woesei DSM 14684]